MAEFVGILILLLVVNGAPVVAARCLGERFNAPLDGNAVGKDGRPLLGSAKTWRGVLVAVLLGSLLGQVVLGSFIQGALFALMAMLGDALASFVKRRRGLQPSEQALGWDHLPESVLPVLSLYFFQDLSVLNLIGLPVAFLLSALFLSRILFFLRVRKRPY